MSEQKPVQILNEADTAQYIPKYLATYPYSKNLWGF